MPDARLTSVKTVRDDALRRSVPHRDPEEAAMNAEKNQNDGLNEDELNEGAYTDVETEDGHTTHETDVEPGSYTDVDRGDGTTR
jgi:hypothetical protein